MAKLRFALLGVGMLALVGGSLGQEKGKDAKKDDPKVVTKGQLPMYWKDIVTEDQKPKIYAIQAKYKSEIDELEEKIKELKGKQQKEMLAILSAEQRTKLEEKLKEKAGLKKDK